MTYSRADAVARRARALPLLAAGHGGEEIERLTDGAVTARQVKRYLESSAFKAELAELRATSIAKGAAAIEEAQAAGVASAVEVQVFLTRVMRGEITETRIVGAGEGAYPLEVCALKDRTKAAELLGKVHGMFVEKPGPDDGPKQPTVTIVVAQGDVVALAGQKKGGE